MLPESTPHRTIVNVPADLAVVALETPLTIPEPEGAVVIHVVTREAQPAGPMTGGA